MYGIQIAFKDFKAGFGILGSLWVGFKHFERFFNSFMFWTLIKNTLSISLYQLAAIFPLSIFMAVCLHYAYSSTFKRITQTVTYAPHFISQVVMVGMLLVFFSPNNGIVNVLIKALGGEPVFFMGTAALFKHMYVWSDVWQQLGFSSIIYIAVLTNVNPELHESAIMDGANKIKRVWYIDLPVLAPTSVIILIMNLGRIMSVGFEKIYLMQNAANVMASEVIATYTYKVGILNAEYSFTTAVGLFNNVINLILLFVVNRVAKSLTDNSLF